MSITRFLLIRAFFDEEALLIDAGMCIYRHFWFRNKICIKNLEKLKSKIKEIREDKNTKKY